MELPPERIGPYVRALMAGLQALAPSEDHVPLSAALDHLAALDPHHGGALLYPGEIWARTGMPTYAWLERARSEAEFAARSTGPEPSEAELVRVHALDPDLSIRMRARRDLHRHLKRAELLPSTRLLGAVRWHEPPEARIALAYDRIAPDGRWARVRVELVLVGEGGPLQVDFAGRLRIDASLRHLMTRHFGTPLEALRTQLEQSTLARVTRLSRSWMGPFWFPGVQLPVHVPPGLGEGLLLHASTEVIDPVLPEHRLFDPLVVDPPEKGGWPTFRERRFAAAGRAERAAQAWSEQLGLKLSIVPLSVGPAVRRL
jgi:hypothetical protein